MTITWHMVLDFTPRIALATGTWNYFYRALRETKECVLSIPAVDLAEKAVSIGDCSGANVDKLRKFGLTPLPAATGKTPLIAECLADLECRVTGYMESPGIFLLQGTHAWINPDRKERRTFHANGDGTFERMMVQKPQYRREEWPPAPPKGHPEHSRNCYRGLIITPKVVKPE